MKTEGEFTGEIGGTIHRLHEQLDNSVVRTTSLHRTGANEEAVLAETAVAVGAAQALEVLTGESWEMQLQRREMGPAVAPAPKPKRRLRRSRDLG